MSLFFTHLYFILFTSVFNNSDVLLFLIRIHNTFVCRLFGEKAERKSVAEEEGTLAEEAVAEHEVVDEVVSGAEAEMRGWCSK